MLVIICFNMAAIRYITVNIINTVISDLGIRFLFEGYCMAKISNNHATNEKKKTAIFIVINESAELIVESVTQRHEIHNNDEPNNNENVRVDRLLSLLLSNKYVIAANNRKHVLYITSFSILLVIVPSNRNTGTKLG